MIDNEKSSVIRARSIVENYSGPEIRIMEVCGTHTHEIFRLGIRSILPDNIQLISGPGCPVCVTPMSYIDEAVYLALEKNAIICTFGDLVRVPGSEMSMWQARGKGGTIKTVYSPVDAVKIAGENPDREVVFLAVGFETTTPGVCIALEKAVKEGITNFSLLTANKTMRNAYIQLKTSADAYMYPGHVSTMTGMGVYRELARDYGISGAVTGFTASEIITALATIIKKLGEGKPFAENCYPRVVTEEGSRPSRVIVNRVMEPCDAEWRGLGVIHDSGMRLKEEYSSYDARKKFSIPEMNGVTSPGCRCGEILLGQIKPYDCPLYGKVCTPEHPVGACMVSGEGTCSAYYKYGKLDFIK